MADISVNGLNKYFGEHHVLKDITFEVNHGEHVGLIGQNGSGKTTLFGILTGKLEHDSGDIYINPRSRLGLLEQLPEYPDDMTVKQVLLSAFTHIFDIEKRLHELERDMSPEVMGEYSGKNPPIEEISLAMAGK